MIKIDGVTKRFGDFVALDNISFEINDGAVYGLVGINGAGKSTLLRSIMGIYTVDGGSVTMDGEPITDNPAALGRIAFVADDLYLPNGYTLLGMASKYRQLFPHFNNDRFAELTAAFELDPKKRFGSYSKGMRRQAATILALSLEADYTFFDETFDGLDPFKRAYVKRIIKEEVARRGCTVMVTSHSLRELEDICDRLAILDGGNIVFESDAAKMVNGGVKVQIAFDGEYGAEKFAELDVVDFSKRGSVASVVIRGEADEVTAKLREMSPILLEILPLGLEEIFSFELSQFGRADLFESISGGENDEK